MTGPRNAAEETLRGDILTIGIDDFVSMADVDGLIDDGDLAASVAERQQLAIRTVRSLLEDSLIEVGGIPTPDNPGFKTWPGTVEEVMTRFAARFIEHYEDRHEWAYRIWLNLTPAGRQASATFNGAS